MTKPRERSSAIRDTISQMTQIICKNAYGQEFVASVDELHALDFRHSVTLSAIIGAYNAHERRVNT